MKRELVDTLSAYLMGWKTVRDCAEWLSSIDWDSSLDPELQRMVGRFELLTTEVMEGLRPEIELWQEAAEFVGNESNSSYIQPMSLSDTIIAESSNCKNSSIVEISVQLGEAVEGSQPWSISPLLVSE